VAEYENQSPDEQDELASVLFMQDRFENPRNHPLPTESTPELHLTNKIVID